MKSRLILASQSTIRASLLKQAGVSFSVHRANIDESVIKSDMFGQKGDQIALTLAMKKAEYISKTHTQDYILGCDQILSCDEEIFSKPTSFSEARKQICRLRGKSHQLISALCLVKNNKIVWQGAFKANLVMRNFSDEFLDHYLEIVGDSLYQSVGGYQIEGQGIQLFESIEGDYTTILGLPLLPLLNQLRTLNILIK